MSVVKWVLKAISVAITAVTAVGVIYAILTVIGWFAILLSGLPCDSYLSQNVYTARPSPQHLSFSPVPCTTIIVRKTLVTEVLSYIHFLIGTADDNFVQRQQHPTTTVLERSRGNEIANQTTHLFIISTVSPSPSRLASTTCVDVTQTTSAIPRRFVKVGS